MRHLLITGLALLLLSACATSPTGRSQLMLISPEQAISESKSAYASTVTEVTKEHQLISDPAWTDRISTITGRLVTEAIKKYPDTADWEWSVAIIDDPETLNAWCMAGGRMAIYSGIVTKLELTDDEIAQIMGHEISHALAHHTAEKMSRAVLVNAGLAVTSKVTDQNGYVLTGSAIAAQLALQLPNSRDAEREADEIGIELATRAGYRPEAAVSLWRKMSEAGGGGPEFLSTHPSPDNRMEMLRDLGNELKPLNPSLTKSRVHPVRIVTNADELR
ncbi:M48 family metallopeptidase [Saccharospirillum salsuginis]|uniref:Lipoprotein n=1 Tax=Saccharospirillum salsuginis TaxID=418750 RepID=A0A918KCP7_9GAMM|nr:M48 family metallopeptidase [Saccharospirillum salsuginis]GGX57724.1 lipoprotein [Saccharospirillum salsuginis]